MKRHYLCDVIGDGTEDSPYRPAIADREKTWAVSSIPSDASGRPTADWTLVRVEADDHAALEAEFDALPDMPMSERLSTLTAVNKTRLRDMLTQRGVNASVVTNASSFADVLLRIGRALDPAFNGFR